MSPPPPTSTIMTYMTQKCGVRSISAGVLSTDAWRTFLETRFTIAAAVALNPSGGAARKSAARITMIPWMMPNWKNAARHPAWLMTLSIGATDSAAPAPNPAATSPAVSPRRSGNHFSAVAIVAP